MRTPDSELVRRALDGDKDAFGCLVKRHWTSIHGLVCRLVDDSELAKDLTQDSFIRAYIHLKQLRTPEKFTIWLKKIASNLCFNLLESERVGKEKILSENRTGWQDDLIDPTPIVLERLETQEFKALIHRAINILSPEYRVPTRLFYFENCSYVEIAERLGIALSTVKWRLHRAKKLLMREILTMTEIIEGIKTGFSQLDSVLGGFKPGEFAVIMGAQSTGRSAFIHDIARHVSMKQKMPVLLFSPGMPAATIVSRMLAAEANVRYAGLKTGALSAGDWAQLQSAAKRLSRALIYIDDSLKPDITAIQTEARRMKTKTDFQMLILDHIQLTSRDEKSSREIISEVLQGLSRLSADLKVPVLALSRLDKRPLPSDLGLIEKYADTVLLLRRSDSPNKGIAEITIRKHHGKPSGTARLKFMSEYLSFAAIR